MLELPRCIFCCSRHERLARRSKNHPNLRSRYLSIATTFCSPCAFASWRPQVCPAWLMSMCNLFDSTDSESKKSHGVALASQLIHRTIGVQKVLLTGWPGVWKPQKRPPSKFTLVVWGRGTLIDLRVSFSVPLKGQSKGFLLSGTCRQCCQRTRHKQNKQQCNSSSARRQLGSLPGALDTDAPPTTKHQNKTGHQKPT